MRRREVLFTAGAAMALGAGSDGLAAYRWRKRVVLVFAGDKGDARLERQRRTLKALVAGGDDRDLQLVTVSGGQVEPAQAGDADGLRRRFAVPPGGFIAILIGKDGGVKLRSIEPLGAERLAQTIDAMPMRRDEVRSRDLSDPRRR